MSINKNKIVEDLYTNQSTNAKAIIRGILKSRNFNLSPHIIEDIYYDFLQEFFERFRLDDESRSIPYFHNAIRLFTKNYIRQAFSNNDKIGNLRDYHGCDYNWVSKVSDSTQLEDNKRGQILNATKRQHFSAHTYNQETSSLSCLSIRRAAIKFMKSLPKQQRELAKMFFKEELSVTEVANKLELARSYTSRLRSRLAEKAKHFLISEGVVPNHLTQ